MIEGMVALPKMGVGQLVQSSAGWLIAPETQAAIRHSPDAISSHSNKQSATPRGSSLLSNTPSRDTLIFTLNILFSLHFLSDQ